MSERFFARSLVAATVVGLLVRVVLPEARPVHHDEAVNWYFVSGLLRKGFYDYDPGNYHGPFFFYWSAWSRLLGGSVGALRLPTMLAGAAMVPGAWFLRRWIGDRAASLSAWALAVSPSLVFFARDAIHETTLAAASLGAVVFALRWFEGREKRDAILLGVCLGIMVATKETFLITGVAWGVGMALAWLVGARTAWPDRRGVGQILLGFVLIFVPFYAGFGLHIEGLWEAFQAFIEWGDRGVEGGGHDAPWWRWPKWLGVSDWALVILGTIGLAAAAIRRDPWAVFVSGWLLATVAVYSAVSYKTPWCILQAATPLALLAGWGAAWLDRDTIGRIVVGLLLFSSLLRAVDFSFVRPDDPAAPLVYVQTQQELVDTMAVVKVALDAGATLSSYQDSRYPMNWLLDEPGFEKDDMPEVLDGDMFITKPIDRRKVERRLAGPYRHKTTLFRQGLKLHVWIAERHAAHVPEDWERVGDDP